MWYHERTSVCKSAIAPYLNVIKKTCNQGVNKSNHPNQNLSFSSRITHTRDNIGSPYCNEYIRCYTVDETVSERRIGKHVCNNRTVFSMWSASKSYKEENWGNQWIELCKKGWEEMAGQCSSDLKVPVKKRVSCKTAAVKRRLYVRCSYIETVIIFVLKSVSRIRLVKIEKT
jgi:hypothetical protein